MSSSDEERKKRGPKPTFWECPGCNSRVQGPKKARLDNTCRYCFPCSEKEGILVERILVVDRQENSVVTPLTLVNPPQVKPKGSTLDLDLKKELRHLWRLKCLHGFYDQRSAPSLEVVKDFTTLTTPQEESHPGEMWIRLTISELHTLEDIKPVILRAVCKFIPPSAGDLYDIAAKEAWGIVNSDPTDKKEQQQVEEAIIPTTIVAAAIPKEEDPKPKKVDPAKDDGILLTNHPKMKVLIRNLPRSFKAGELCASCLNDSDFPTDLREVDIEYLGTSEKYKNVSLCDICMDFARKQGAIIEISNKSPEDPPAPKKRGRPRKEPVTTDPMDG